MIFTWDIETRGYYGDIIVIGVYDGVKVKHFFDVSDLVKFLDEVSSKYEKAYFFAHNHEFDLLKLVQDRMRRKENIEVDLFKSTFSNRKAINLVFKRWKNIFFRDTYRIFTSSLEKVTKSFDCHYVKIDLEEKVKKMGYRNKDHFFKTVKPNDSVLLEYLNYDVIGLFEALQKFIEITGVKPQKLTTIAAVAMEVFQTQFEDDYNKIVKKNNGKTVTISKEDRDFIRKAYLGGRVELISRINQDGYAYDVNSLYPSVMEKFEYPTGGYDIYTDDKANAKMNWLIRGVKKGIIRALGIVEATVNIPYTKIPPLPVKINQKLYFPYGKVKGYWTTPELIHAVIKYNVKILNVHKMILWKEKCRPFMRFVNKFYEIKSNATGAKRQVAKLLLNSLYGKFGMREVFEKMIYVEDFNKSEKLRKKEIKRKSVFCGKEVNVIDEIIKPDYIQPHIAAYITSYSRLILLQKIEDLLEDGYDVWYYDTDCIHTNCKPDNFKDVDDKKLGYWSIDRQLDEAIYLLPKFYISKSKDKEKIKMKGIPKEYMLSYDEAKALVENKKIYEHIFESERLPSLRKQLMNTEVIEKEKIRKAINLLYDKRKFINDNNTEPWRYEEILNLNISIRIYQKNGEISEIVIKVNDEEVRSFDEYIKICKNLEERKEDVNKELLTNQCTV